MSQPALIPFHVDADASQGIALDANANAYVAGSTASKDFPITAGAPQPVFSDALNRFPVPDAFVAKLVDLVPPPPPAPTVAVDAFDVTAGSAASPLLPPVVLPPPVVVPPLRGSWGCDRRWVDQRRHWRCNVQGTRSKFSCFAHCLRSARVIKLRKEMNQRPQAFPG